MIKRILVLLFLSSEIVMAQQPGALDVSFNSTDIGFIPDLFYTQECMALQPDGKIILADRKIKRVNTDGSLDPSFIVNTNLMSGDIYDILLQPDGKILIGGTFNDYYGTPRKSIARLNANGSIDPTFQVGSGFNGGVFTLALQPDGKIVAAGSFEIYNGDSTGYFARLNPDGSLDTSFNSVGVLDTGYVWNMAIASSGKIVACGYFDYLNTSGNITRGLLRLNTNGTRDTTFGIGIGFNNETKALLIQQTGEIIIAGYFQYFNSVQVPRGIIRLNENGSPDTTFITPGFDGISSSVFITELSLQADGKIVAVGSFSGYGGMPSNQIVRINSDGTYDPGFIAGLGFNSYPVAVLSQPDGKVVVNGDFTIYDIHGANEVIRLMADGSPDSTFRIITGFNSPVNTVSILPSGKILAGGSFTSFNKKGIFGCAVINNDGSLDTSFVQLSRQIYSVSSTAVQNDGKIVLKGSIYTWPLSSQTMTRLLPGGTIDTTFHLPSIGQWGTAGYIAIQPDQKVVVEMGGGKLIRIFPGGNVDSAFSMMQDFDEQIWSLTILPDNKILVAGKFTAVQGQNYNGIVRLMPDGSIDTTFNPGAGVGGGQPVIYTVAVQDDGKYILGGSFTTYNGISRNKITRINSDGSLDNSFFVGTGISGTIYSVLIQPDAKVILGGAIFSYNSVLLNGICRLNSNGLLDNTFITGNGFPENSGPLSMAFTSDWKIIAAGSFTSYNGTGRNHIARIHANNNNCNTPPAGIQLSTTGNEICQGDSVTLYRVGGYAATGGSFKWYSGSCGGTLVGTGDSITVAPSATTLYTLRAESQCGNSPCAIKTVFVNSINPVISGPSALCQGDTITLSASGNYASWLWSTGETTSSIQVSGPGSYTVTVSVTGLSCVGTNTLTVVAGTANSVNIQGNTAICSNQTSTLDAGSFNSYLWSNGTNTQSIVVSNPGLYIVTVTDMYGCTGTDSVSVTVIPAPLVNITSTGNTTFCLGDSVILAATAGLASYQWYNRNYLLPGAISENYTAKSRGKYKCIAQNSMFCADTSNIIVVNVPCIPIGPNHERNISNIEFKFRDFKISPNPSTGVFSIQSPPGQLLVFNPLGQVILSMEITEEESKLDISEYSDGIYFVTISTEETTNFRQIIMAR